MNTGIPVREHPSFRTAHVVRTVRTGTSGATVRIVRQPDGQLLAVKTATNPRVPAHAQAAARKSIEPFFGSRLPEVFFAGSIYGTDTLITRCPSTTTLADAVHNQGTHGPAPAVWKDVVTMLGQVWQRTAEPGFDMSSATRKHQLRWQRGTTGLRYALHQAGLPAPLSRHVVVNDIDHGPLNQILNQLASIPAPTIHVACQGDPQPRNILLDPANHWHLVDWEWAGLHQDWRMMTSHLVGWWHVEDLLAHAHGDATLSPSALTLQYEAPETTLPTAWTAPVVDAFSQMTSATHHERDLTALARHTAMLLLREIPKSAAAGREHQLAPLLGEATRLIRDMAHPLLSPFAPPQPTSGSRP